MITYKGFEKGLICRGYQFTAGIANVCEKAKTAREGFHSAENPLDVLAYYPNPETSEYWKCAVSGDIDEDGNDSKVSSTEITPINETGIEGILLWGAVEHLDRADFADANIGRYGKPAASHYGYAISMGEGARAMGSKEGDYLLIVEGRDATLLVVGENDVKPGVWYNARGGEVSV